MRISLRPSLLQARRLATGLVFVTCAGIPPAVAQPGGPAPSSSAVGGVRLRVVGPDAPAGRASAVVVETGSLVHTALLYPLNGEGRLQGGADATAQAAHVLGSLEAALTAAGTGLDHIARLHVYVSDNAVTPAVDRLIAQRFTRTTPALTIVQSTMPHPGVLVAMDAIAATSRQQMPGAPARRRVDGLAPVPGQGAHVAVQPAGPFVIVSGRAAPGEFDVAVRGTMAQLRGDLETVGLAMSHVVQVKAFLGDMAQAERLQRLVASTFEGTAPPQVVTEWRNSSLPVEIELVATAPGARDGEARLTLVEPISARYSRIARIFGGAPVFVSGLTGASTAPTTQVREIFAELARVLAAAGSDMRHIAKATYYVSDPGADQEINTVRPSIYDPARPPAASKISVQGTGRAGRSAAIDAIAVTTSR